jgi:hypothetical protein
MHSRFGVHADSQCLRVGIRLRIHLPDVGEDGIGFCRFFAPWFWQLYAIYTHGGSGY